MTDLTNYRDDLRHIEDVMREGFAQTHVRLDTIRERLSETEGAVEVLKDRSGRLETEQRTASTWSRFIGPAIAALSGLLSGQIRP